MAPEESGEIGSMDPQGVNEIMAAVQKTTWQSPLLRESSRTRRCTSGAAAPCAVRR